MNLKKGFIIIIVVASLAIIVLIILCLIEVGSSEILQTRVNNNIISAEYVAMAGAERMYGRLKSLQSSDVTWPQPTLTGAVSTGTLTTGNFTANANTFSSDVFAIVSQGVVNGRAVTVTVKYGYTASSTAPSTLGAGGSISLSGTHGTGNKKSWVHADGPLDSGHGITINDLVQVQGPMNENQTIAMPSFWLYTKFDTTNTGFAYSDGGTGSITRAEALVQNPAMIATFDTNDVNGDGVIDDKDAFYYYYTSYLDQPANNMLGQDLAIGPGDIYYFSGDQNFEPGSIPSGTPIIFVDGNVNILFNSSEWWGAACNNTIIATGTITITQPSNGGNDTLTLVAYGDVITGGEHSFGGVNGNLIVYTNGNFIADYGGKTNGTVLAKGDIIINTQAASGQGENFNRDFKRLHGDWTEPLGLPSGYRVVTIQFIIKDETGATGGSYKPMWQRD